MADGLSRKSRFSEKEKKRIAQELIEGYKKMAPLNRELAEEYFIKGTGEAND